MSEREQIGEIKMRTPNGSRSTISVDRDGKGNVGVIFSRSSEGEALMMLRDLAEVKEALTDALLWAADAAEHTKVKSALSALSRIEVGMVEGEQRPNEQAKESP